MNSAIRKTGRCVGRIMIMATTLLSLANATADDRAQQGANVVQIHNYIFSPKTLTVAAGTTVTWVNHDEEPHTVTSADRPRAFNAPPIEKGEKFSFNFATAGSFKYFCAIHPQMIGLIVVK